MNIKIVGSGCSKCESLSASVKKVASENNIDCTIEKITDIEKIIEMGIMTTPVLIVDDVKVAVGKVPSEAEILGFLELDAKSCCKDEAKQEPCSCTCACQSEKESSCGCGCDCGESKGGLGKKLVRLVLLAFVLISLGYVVVKESFCS